MKRILTYMTLCLSLAVVSCSKNDMKEAEKGYGALCVNMTVAQTKAMTEEQLMESATVKIYKDDFSGLVRSYKYSEIPSPFYLAADNYRVDVEAGECTSENPSAASWDNKSYKGSEKFTISAGQVTDVEVVAVVNNAITKITFDQTVADNFNPGYSFTIGLDDNAQLVYDASKSGAEGYFIVAGLEEPSLSWTFSGVLSKDGSEFVKTGVIENLLPGKIYKMNLKYTIKDGDLMFSLVVDYTTDIVDDSIVFEPVSTGLSATPVYEVWAKRTTVYADVDPNENAGAKIQFAYKASNSDSWSFIDGDNYSDGMWKAVITGLEAETEYTYSLVINDEFYGETRTVTTDAAPKLPNGSFEYTSLVTGKSYYKFYDPNCGVAEGSYMFWGSGNGEGPDGVNGSASMNVIITTVDTGDKVDGNQSVIAQSSEKAGVLAAGNLFTGQFDGLVGTEGGKVNFGRPWTSRPSALRIYCKYSTDKINIVGSQPAGMSLSKSDYDRAQIKVAIGTWNYKTYGGVPDNPVHVDTTDPSTFVDYYDDASTIANGDVIIYNDGYSINKATKVSKSTSSWIEYIIPLEYHNVTSYPTHIVISCAASQYGDYFTGCSSSKLWVDAAELIYE